MIDSVIHKVIELHLPGPDATDSLAQALARVCRQGDVIGLRGELGAGKTTLARAFIRARGAMAGQPCAEEVPSPTFTLVQIYHMGEVAIWHFDLYRLERSADAIELGIDEAFATAISLVEWPERLDTLLPSDRLEVSLDIPASDGPSRDGDREDTVRTARLTGFGTWRDRLEDLDLHD